MKKVGIFSGTFDPIHDGHISFALEAAQKAGLDKVFFLPEPRPRRKQGVKALEHRVRMVQLAVEKYAQLGVIVLEQTRFTSHETLPLLQARFKGAQLYMLMGEDMLNHLVDWPHVDELINNVHFVIGLRHRDVDDIKALVKNLETTRGLKFVYDIFQTKWSSVSSSNVRQTLRRGGMPRSMNNEVINYVQANELYSISGE